jgi:hypothetical protein
MLVPPPPPRTYTEEWNIVQIPFLQSDGTARDPSRGAVGAMTQRLVNGRTLDLSLRAGPMHTFQCPLEDDGRETCALTCASEHLSRLRAFTVTGENLKSSPPPRSPPNPPPAPPPPFVAGENDRFNACQDSCTNVEKGEIFCRDGGYGSFTPALCPYSTQCSKCGPRTEVRSTTTVFEGDDTCEYANDGICEDGRPSTEALHSSFVVVSEGVWAHLCGFLTDRSDCGPGTIPTVSAESFSTTPAPPRPHPPPPDPLPPPPPETFNGCRIGDRACSFVKHCSDGGLNSFSNGHDPESSAATFYCGLGTQCNDALCPPRINDDTLCIDSCRSTVSGRVKWEGQSRNGI